METGAFDAKVRSREPPRLPCASGGSLELVCSQSYDTKMGELLNEAEGEDMISDWHARAAAAGGGPRSPLSRSPHPFRTEVAETFDSMGLHENLLRGIYAYGGQPHAPHALSDL